MTRLSLPLDTALLALLVTLCVGWLIGWGLGLWVATRDRRRR